MFATKRIPSKVQQLLKKSEVCQIHSGGALLQQSQQARDDYLKLNISGESLKFPYVWLRDNCQCDKCFQRHSEITPAQKRIVDWSNFNLGTKPANVVQGKSKVQVTWDDGHTSQYATNWLMFRNFTPENKKKYDDTVYKPAKIPWNDENFDKIFSKHDYIEVMNADVALYNFLENLSMYGIAMIKNTPLSETAIDELVDKVGYIKRTHYGAKCILQKDVTTHGNVNESKNLPMHVDLPYYEYCPGINMLHCLVQTESNGGENLVSDCIYVANYMKQHHPEEFKLLTETEVEWSDVGVKDGKEFFKLYRAPVISLDRQGNFNRVTFSIPKRGSHFPGPIDLVKPWYEAHALFLDLNHKFSAKFKTTPGDILAFENIRLLHGRTGYEDSTSNVRKLMGTHLDWDEIYSRLRTLKVKLQDVKGIH